MYYIDQILSVSVFIKLMTHMASVYSDLYHSYPYIKNCVCKAGAAQCQRGFNAV